MPYTERQQSQIDSDGLFRTFLDKLQYPSAGAARDPIKKDAFWQLDNPLNNGEEGLAIAIAQEKGISFSYLPEHMRKNAELGCDAIKNRLLELYKIAKKAGILARNFNGAQRLDAFIAQAEHAAAIFDPMEELKTLKKEQDKKAEVVKRKPVKRGRE